MLNSKKIKGNVSSQTVMLLLKYLPLKVEKKKKLETGGGARCAFGLTHTAVQIYFCSYPNILIVVHPCTRGFEQKGTCSVG